MNDVREEMVRRDPIADYDHLGRKVPKRLGLLEVARAVPALRGLFDREVPADRFIVEEGQAVVECQCGTDVYADHNIASPCGGGCGRWFWLINGRLLVARIVPPPHVET